jgi:hypothetical protein
VEPDFWAPVLEAVTRCVAAAAEAVAGPVPLSAGAATIERGRRPPGPLGIYTIEFHVLFNCSVFWNQKRNRNWIPGLRISGSGSGSRRAKITHKSRKKFHVLKCWMASFES